MHRTFFLEVTDVDWIRNEQIITSAVSALLPGDFSCFTSANHFIPLSLPQTRENQQELVHCGVHLGFGETLETRLKARNKNPTLFQLEMLHLFYFGASEEVHCSLLLRVVVECCNGAITSCLDASRQAGLSWWVREVGRWWSGGGPPPCLSWKSSSDL